MAARGSTKLLRQQKISKADIDRLLKKIDEIDVAEILHLEQKGQPNPDAVYGVIRARPGSAGTVVDALLELENVRFALEAFPYGIPFPDEVLINFRNGGGPQF